MVGERGSGSVHIYTLSLGISGLTQPLGPTLACPFSVTPASSLRQVDRGLRSVLCGPACGGL